MLRGGSGGVVLHRQQQSMEVFDGALVDAEALNVQANELFGSKRYDEAVTKYSSAVDLVELHAQRVKEAERPFCKYLCNRAAALLASGYHCEALKDCDVALTLDPLLDKALLRRALACEALGKNKEAMQDVQQMLGRTEWGSALHARALDLKRRLDRVLWQESQVTESNQAEHLFTSDQTLRLNFRTPPPGAVADMDYFEVSVFVANEFGLFSAKKFEAQAAPVQLDLAAIGQNLRSLRVRLHHGGQCVGKCRQVSATSFDGIKTNPEEGARGCGRQVCARDGQSARRYLPGTVLVHKGTSTASNTSTPLLRGSAGGKCVRVTA